METKLKSFVVFLRNEVENVLRISIATEGIKCCNSVEGHFGYSKKPKQSVNNFVLTATGLVNLEAAKCIICAGQYFSYNYFRAQHFSFQENIYILREIKEYF